MRLKGDVWAIFDAMYDIKFRLDRIIYYLYLYVCVCLYQVVRVLCVQYPVPPNPKTIAQKDIDINLRGFQPRKGEDFSKIHLFACKTIKII